MFIWFDNIDLTFMILFTSMVCQACVLHERGTLLELVDPDLGSVYSEEEAKLMLNVALLCTNSSPSLRPTMSKVVSLLEGRASLQPFLSNVSTSTNSLSSKRAGRNFWQNLSGSRSQSAHASGEDYSELDPEDDVSLQLLVDAVRIS